MNAVSKLGEASSARDLPREQWDALLRAEDVFLASRWLDVVDATAGVPLRYWWVSRQGELVAALPTAHVTTDVPWALGRLDVVLENSQRDGLGGATELMDTLTGAAGGDSSSLMPSLAIGGRHVGSTRLLRADSARADDIDLLLSTAESHAQSAGLRSVAMLYLDESEGETAAALNARGYLSCQSGTFSRLLVPRTGFEGYLAALPSKRRISVASERRRIRESNVEVRTVPLDSAPLRRLAELESMLLAKYGIPNTPECLLPILEQTQACFGRDAFAGLLYGDAEIRGFVVVLRQGDVWVARQAGFDYEYQHSTRLPLYFELIYYALIEAAAEAGVREIHYGLGSADTKRKRGCRGSTQRLYVLPLGTGDACG